MGFRLLLIEDERDKYETIKEKLENISDDIHVDDLTECHIAIDSGSAPEDQVYEYLKGAEKGSLFDLAIVDRTLIRFAADGNISAPHDAPSIRAALNRRGIPILSYQKKVQGNAELARYKYRATQTAEGSRMISFPTWRSSGDDFLADLSESAIQYANGFKSIHQSLLKLGTENVHKYAGTADLLATLLDKPELTGEFEAYSDTYSAYFSELPREQELKEIGGEHDFLRILAAQLGYWLCNTIQPFPGPIINAPATAAQMGISSTDVLQKNNNLLKLLEHAQYKGPFSEVFCSYWYYDVVDVIENSGELSDLLRLVGAKVSDDNDPEALRYCVVTEAPFDGAYARPNWIPKASALSFVKRDIHQMFTPWMRQ